MKIIKDISYSFNHTNKRLNERFNLSITYEEYNTLSILLAVNKSKMILVEDGTQEIHQLKFKGKVVTFVYSKVRECVTTVLNWN